jgi:hypothetical protein
MSAPEPVTPKLAQAAAPQGVSAKRGRQSVREKYGRNWLFRFNYLPPWPHRRAVERLLRGDTISEVARWLLRHPNRGGMSKITSEETMRRYVSVLAEEVRKRRLMNPGPTLDDLAASGMVAPTALVRRPGASAAAPPNSAAN